MFNVSTKVCVKVSVHWPVTRAVVLLCSTTDFQTKRASKTNK